MHAERIDSYDATAVQVYFSAEDAERWVDVIESDLNTYESQDEEIMRSLLTRIGAIAEADRGATLILSEREYAELDGAAHVGDMDSPAAKQIENDGIILDAKQQHDHRAVVDDSKLPR